MNLSKLLRRLLCLAIAASLPSAVFAAAITTAVSPVGPISVGATFTVTLSMSGYSGIDEIDGYEFKITYPTALFTLIGGSGALHDGAGFGAAENWLRTAPQDGVGAGAILTDGTTSLAGTVNVSVVDLRGSSTRGTTTAAGFLYSFDLMATAPGTGSIAPALPGSGTVLYDVSLSGVGPAPTFSGASMTVVPEPGSCVLAVAGIAVLLTGRMRRR